MENNNVILTDSEIRSLLTLIQNASFSAKCAVLRGERDKDKTKAYTDKLNGISRNLYYVLMNNERHKDCFNHD